jgi:Mn2+/Fe2+ NRAMP family transporter
MGASNLVALFIILATGATLHASGITTIETTAQAAEALRPIAGEFAYVVFAAGVIGTGLLAVPVLAGSSAYALSEAFGWREGLDLRPAQATWFYATIAAATLAGVALNATPLNPVRALYWSAVVNGVLAAPVMAVMMLIGGSERVMGALTLPRPMLLAGWAATALMLLASIGLLVL